MISTILPPTSPAKVIALTIPMLNNDISFSKIKTMRIGITVKNEQSKDFWRLNNLIVI